MVSPRKRDRPEEDDDNDDAPSTSEIPKEVGDEEEDTEENTKKATEEEESDPPKRLAKVEWAPVEDEALMLAVIADRKNRGVEADEDEEEDWDEISKDIEGKTPVQCLRRYMRHLNRKEGGGSKGSNESFGVSAGKSDEEDEKPESTSETSQPPAKKVKKSKDAPVEPQEKWEQPEVDLLKKLVEQYQDSEFRVVEECVVFSFVESCVPSRVVVAHFFYAS